ncbi:hypothetical protein K505DRAFT_405417 [Melanomma pulvis-pyrius CBS 109.77]|uniref:Zn(2)-C6 fungal-type domain-containing protein n=1 Tax=Melanomma pulvis-pyrius CBS 109.77 TaxID=1314802 RepID=A0A6A6XQ10_9PLEO|nr:hypothetical protein K505DRAFT_405417 [Melanomma pulvis-pyrius CBS 109.77]
MPNMPRRRAVNVCSSCHNHKIRCDVDSTSIPCSKCSELGEECTLRARKQYRSRKRLRRVSKSSIDDEHVINPLSAPSHLDPAKIVAAAITEPSSRTAPIFVGDGGYGAILDATGDVTDRHFHVPAAAEKALAAEDLEYLKVKGCFSLPSKSSELLKAYFQFVHPSFPIIDGPSFLRDYAAGGLEGINLLLLWSMFSVSASYIPLSFRKAVKESCVHRAKLLFDMSQENDKIVLVQSSLLLSFWFADTEDVKQSWYWTSIAFGIAQTLGLHREVKTTHGQVSIEQRSLWRNIWWCCMIRDVWLAFGMGRPLRINASDCDCPAPSYSDCQFSDMVFHDEALYSAAEVVGHVSIWQSLVTTSNVLRDILTTKAPSPTFVKALEAQINTEATLTATSLLRRADLHLRLHQQATLIALARCSGNKDKSKAAAEATTAIVQAFLDDNTTAYVAPVAVPLLIPAMVTYLATTRSKRPDARKLGHETLEIYTRFLSTLEDNYPAASIVKQLFAAAQASIDGKDSKRDRQDRLTPDGQSSSSWDVEWPFGIDYSRWIPGGDSLADIGNA